MPDALVGQGGEALIQLGSHIVTRVVIGEELDGLTPLLVRIESSLWQAIDIDVGARNGPVDLFDGNIVGHPSLHPAIEPRHKRFVGIIGIAWGERLEAVKSVEISDCPRDQWRQSSGG